VKGDSFELHTQSQWGPVKVDKKETPKEEYLNPSFFLDSADAKVKELADKAVGKEADPWARAKRIEGWVHQHMTVDDGVNYVPASRTAQDLRGDCRQHAMLTAAMCRAAGVPSRTALGLVYARDSKRGPILAFHMWTEVAVDGQWLGLDATLGRGGVTVGHLKITDASWSGVSTLAPTLSVGRVMGKIKVELVKVEE
jgi:transglutaminase-like putative cysteine protease